jgi:hypothetical protein
LPIGNQTSQFWANVLLHAVDLDLVHVARPGAAVRYVDDLVLFDDDPAALVRAQRVVEAALARLRLRAHPTKTRLVRVRDGFTFVGYRIDDAAVRLPRATVSRFHRRLHGLQRASSRGDVGPAEVRAVVAGMHGHAHAAGLSSVLTTLLDDHPFVRCVEPFLVGVDDGHGVEGGHGAGHAGPGENDEDCEEPADER